MRKLISILATGTLFALAGCDLPPPPAALAVAPTTYHDVAYYDAHPLQRSQTNSWCLNNPGLAAKIPSCDSADTSGIKAWHHEMGWK